MKEPRAECMRTQWESLKKKNENAILIFRFANCYAMFYSDAETAASVFGMKSFNNRFSLPVKKADECSKWLRQEGYKVKFIEEREP